MKRWTLLATAFCFAALTPVNAKPVSPIVAAVADTAHRSADNVKLDVGRKPAELLSFLGLKRGMKVADMFGGNLYWSEIMAPAVSPAGHVTIWNPTQFTQGKTKDGLAAFAAAHRNVTVLTSPFEAPVLPRRAFDFMLINLNYHDVYWTSAEDHVVRMEPRDWLRTVAASIKPGGIIGVVDHVGPAGDTRAVVDKFHRIDPATVRADFKRAGFVLIGESKMLANPADDHSLGVYKPEIRGKTDRFVFRFRKAR